MLCCLTASTGRALHCIADAEFGIQVTVEAVVACPEPEQSLVPVWLSGSRRGQPCIVGDHEACHQGISLGAPVSSPPSSINGFNQ